VKCFRRYPTNIRRQQSHLIAEFCDSLAYTRVDVKCYE
jgi:hypothetical protein